MITEGRDVLDSVIAGVNIVELDPLDDSVGYGGCRMRRHRATGFVVHAWTKKNERAQLARWKALRDLHSSLRR